MPHTACFIPPLSCVDVMLLQFMMNNEFTEGGRKTVICQDPTSSVEHLLRLRLQWTKAFDLLRVQHKKIIII